jgi:hypothetical protein
MLGFERRTGSLSVEEAIAEYGEPMVRMSFGSNSRVRATNAHSKLSWGRKQMSLLDDIERGSYKE